MTISKPIWCRPHIAVPTVVSLVLLGAAWWWAGYVPTHLIQLNNLIPVGMAKTKQGPILIAATRSLKRNLIESMESPLLLLDPATGQSIAPPIVLPPVEDSCLFAVRVSGDGNRIFTLRQIQIAESTRPYRINVYDRVTNQWKAERDFSWDSPYWHPSHEQPTITINSNGRFAYCQTWKKHDNNKRPSFGLLAWDIDKNQELFHLKSVNHAAILPDGKMLAVRTLTGSEQSAVQLFDARTGALISSVDAQMPYHSWEPQPRFSPDGRYTAIGTSKRNDSKNHIRVIETDTGKDIFDSHGYSPRFLAGGYLVFARESAVPLKAMAQSGQPENAHEVVIHDVIARREIRRDVFDLGFSPMSGIIPPRPFALSEGNRYGLIYETSMGWWSGSPKASADGVFSFFRSNLFNMPGGLGLDIVDAASGSPKTYHLNDAFLWYPFPDCDQLLLPLENGKYQVWDIPPRRTYRGFAFVATALALMWLAVLTTRRFWIQRSPTTVRLN